MILTGTVKWFNNEKGYGFIEVKDMDDIYVHYSSIIKKGYKSLIKGEIVQFELIKINNRYSAKNVKSTSVVA